MLPEGIEEIFPDEAELLEQLGRRLVDRFALWGYRPVKPPMVDYLDSLLIGSGHALDLQTIKFPDPISGRLMGLRADMTPQVARIDARTAKRGIPARLCYLGSVVHGIAGHLEKNRNPVQIGAELFGHGGLRATLEVIRLMLDMLDTVEVKHVHLDLGHVGIYRAIAQEAGLTEGEEKRLFDVLQRKDASELEVILEASEMNRPLKTALRALPSLHGSLDLIATARDSLAAGGMRVMEALDELMALGQAIRAFYPDLPLHVDLAELRGYDYHTGIVFAAFVPAAGSEIARGGRYDDIGRVFGFARPAVGFSADLGTLSRLSAARAAEAPGRILAPALEDPELEVAIHALRCEGRIVIQALGEAEETLETLGCTLALVREQGQWVLRERDLEQGRRNG